MNVHDIKDEVNLLFCSLNFRLSSAYWVLVGLYAAIHVVPRKSSPIPATLYDKNYECMPHFYSLTEDRDHHESVLHDYYEAKRRVMFFTRVMIEEFRLQVVTHKYL